VTVREHDPFPALPQPTTINPEDISNLGNVTIRGDIRSYAWDGGGSLEGGVDATATGGFFLDSSAGSAQFEGSLFLGGALAASGDIYSTNWDGAIPANLTTTHDATATAGFYFDGSAGSPQFEGNVYLGGNLKFIAAAGILDFGDGFDMRVYQDNPAVGEDSLWIRGNTDDTDHVVIGPAAGAERFKNFRIKANQVETQGKIVFDTTAGSGNEQIRFDDAAYGIFQDNVGSGTDNSRLWVNAPDEGEIVLGPRAGSSFLDRLHIISDQIRFVWSDGVDSGIHAWPKGITFDFGQATITDDAAVGVYPENLTGLVATATVPANISVTIRVWCWVRLDLALDQEIAFLDVTIGGTAPQLPATIEQDLTSSAAGTGNTGSAGTGNTGSAGPNAVAGFSGSFDGHIHASGSYESASHTHTGPSHTHTGPSHTHALSSSFKTLFYCGSRSFTPTGTAITVQARGGSGSGTAQDYDDGLLMYDVVVN